MNLNREEIKLEDLTVGQEFTIPLLGSDFRNTRYTDNKNCPLAKAFKRHFWLSHSVSVTPDIIKIDEENEPTYIFDIVGRFSYPEFKDLREKVENTKGNAIFDEVIYNVKIIFVEQIN
jgi:hypothetical protein